MGNQEMSNETRILKENFVYFGTLSLIYGIIYAVCMYHNPDAVTYPVFIGATIAFMAVVIKKLGHTLKKEIYLYYASILLLAVSTFCTDDFRIIFFNKTGIFLLMLCSILQQWYHTGVWKFSKYVGSMVVLFFESMGELARPIADGREYFRDPNKKKHSMLVHILIGILISVPLVFVIMFLLADADAVFRQITERLLKDFSIGSLFGIMIRIVVVSAAFYAVVACLCRGCINEEAKERRGRDPVVAITVTGILSVIYVFFSAIQIVYLFMGKMQLPVGYTYAQYAREGFFQLLVVSIFNLLLVLFVLAVFRENKILKAILTIISVCTLVMIASSAMRMTIYIQYYYLTFQRILVLWSLAVLLVLLPGVITSIYSERFPLFRYGTAVVTMFYILLSFCHPDYIIASVNIQNAPQSVNESVYRENGGFFRSDKKYTDYDYLASLSADAAPAVIPYLEQLGYPMTYFYTTHKPDISQKSEIEKFGYCYLRERRDENDDMSIRKFNLSRYRAVSLIRKTLLKEPHNE